VAVVVNPLRSIMIDQLQRCTDMKITATMVNRANEMSADEKKGLLGHARPIIK